MKESNEKKEVLLFSSGVDSTVGRYYLKEELGVKDLTLVYVDLGHRYLCSEVSFVNFLFNHDFCRDGDVLRVCQTDLGRFEEENGNITARNLLFSLYGAYYGDVIYVVCQEGEMEIPDRSERFFVESSELLSYLFGKKKEVKPLFESMTKQEVVGWYKNKFGNLKELGDKTFSCFFDLEDDNGYFWGCGECKACFRKWIAFEYNGLECWDRFKKGDIRTGRVVQDFLQQVEKYSGRRLEQTLEVLEKYGLGRGRSGQ